MKRLTYIVWIPIFLIVFCVPSALMAQESDTEMVTIQGVIRDKESRQVIYNANIAVVGSNIGTVSNADGVFVLKVPKGELADGLLVSHVGYLNSRITMESITQQEEQLKIWLRPSTEWLYEVNVYGGNPRDLVKQAIEKIEETTKKHDF